MKAGKIFINYRREDSRADAGRLYDRLHGLYPERVFRDVGSLEPGIEWREAIDKVLSNADACIVVIGKNWLTMTDAAGKRRLDDPKDTVRQELQTALTSGMRVFPILVGGAKMPAEEELPGELQALARRNALEVSEQDWNEDFEKLVAALERALGWSAAKPGKSASGSRTALFAIGGAVAAVVVIGIVAVMLWSSGSGTRTNPPVDSPHDLKDAKVPSPEPAPPPPTDVKTDARNDVKPPEPVPAVDPSSSNQAPPRERRRALTPPPNPSIERDPPVASNLAPPAPAPRRPSAVENAEEAFAAGRLVLPRTSSALYWALQAQQAGESGANDILQRTTTAVVNQMQALAREKRFDEALMLVNAYADFYPSDASKQRVAQGIRDEIRQAQQGVRLQVLHRHGIDYRSARCEGWLEIDPMGTVSYACDPKFVHDGRCDRVTFPPGSFTYKPAGEQLRVTNTSGNFDFFAPVPTINQAVQALGAAGARIQTK